MSMALDQCGRTRLPRRFSAESHQGVAQSGDRILRGTNQDGSDGTRTRDLRRDRPVRGSRQLTTIDAESLYACTLPSLRRSDSALLSEADFRRLLPVCCPGWADRERGRGTRLVLETMVAGSTVDPLLTMRSDRQVVATHANGFGLFPPFLRAAHLPPVATGRAR
jgi:hypothetical protein